MSQNPKTKSNSTLRTKMQTILAGSPASWFAFFALLFGLAFALITPPLSTPDEHNHFMRAYQIADGGFLSNKQETGTGGQIPISFLQLAQSVEPFTLQKVGLLDNIDTNDQNSAFFKFENTALYSPIAYAPQAIGIFLGKVFDAPIIYLTYLARIFNVMAYVALIYAAIRLLPFGKWAAAVIGLLPMHVLLTGTVSADPFSMALAVLVVAAVLRLRTYTREMTRKEIVLLSVLALAVSLAKFPFILFLALYLLVPARVLGGTVKRWLILLGGIFLAALILGGTWLALARMESSPYGPAEVDTAKQLAFIMAHPLSFLGTLAKTYLGDFSTIFVQQYVASIGLLQSWLPLWATYVYTIFLAFAVYPLRSVAGTLKKHERLLVAAVGLGCFLITSTIVYLTWNGPGAAIINGIQVRYFTPLLILLIPLLAVRAKSKKQAQEGTLAVATYQLVPVLFLAYAFGLMISWYY